MVLTTLPGNLKHVIEKIRIADITILCINIILVAINHLLFYPSTLFKQLSTSLFQKDDLSPLEKNGVPKNLSSNSPDLISKILEIYLCLLMFVLKM